MESKISSFRPKYIFLEDDQYLKVMSLRNGEKISSKDKNRDPRGANHFVGIIKGLSNCVFLFFVFLYLHLKTLDVL